jgi:hypothetical protein
MRVKVYTGRGAGNGFWPILRDNGHADHPHYSRMPMSRHGITLTGSKRLRLKRLMMANVEEIKQQSV